MDGRNNKLVDDILDLYTSLIVPFMQVQRDMPFPSGKGRAETDSEHVVSLSMISITLAQRLDLNLNMGLVAKYCLVHDLVEAYAGDVSARDFDAHPQKAENEHKALAKIKQKFSLSAPWIPEYIEKYEAKKDDESKFVYVVDKCMGSLTLMADDGKNWPQYYSENDGAHFHEVVSKLRIKAATYPILMDFFDDIQKELMARWPEYLEKYPK